MINKRQKLKILKFFGIRKSKERVLLKNSIRPGKVKTVYPDNWKQPIMMSLSTGEQVLVNPIENLVNTHNALEIWKKQLL